MMKSDVRSIVLNVHFLGNKRAETRKIAYASEGMAIFWRNDGFINKTGSAFINNFVFFTIVALT